MSKFGGLFDTSVQPGAPNSTGSVATPVAGGKFSGLFTAEQPAQPVAPVAPPSPVAVQNFPSTIKSLAELQIDPLSLKANPLKALGDAWDSIKGSVVSAGEAWGKVFYQALNEPMSTSEAIGKGFEATAKTAGAIFSPITAFFAAADQVPVAGSVSRLVTLPFVALGEATPHLSNVVIDKIPDSILSKRDKENIKPGVGEILGLASQLALGKVIDVGAKVALPSERAATAFRTDFVKDNPTLAEDVVKIGTNKINDLVKTHGPVDAKTIIKQAIDLSNERKGVTSPAPVAPSVGKPESIITENKPIEAPPITETVVTPTPESGPVIPEVKVSPTSAVRTLPEIRNDLNSNLDAIKNTGKDLADVSRLTDNGFVPKSGITELQKELVLKHETLRQEFNNARGGSVKIPKELEPLAAEARKYKSAEEFVKAEGITVYRASPSEFPTDTWDKGTYFAPTEQLARYYSESHLPQGVEPSSIKVVKTTLPKTLLNETNGGNSFTLKVDFPVKSQLTDFYSQVAKESPKIPEKITLTETTKPSGIAKSIEAKAVEANLTKGFKDTAQYEPIKIKEQAQKATDLVNSDLETARKIVRGEAELPEGLKGTSLITAMEEYIKKNPSADLAYELANSPLVSETSAAAQELRLAAERTPDSATAKLMEIKQAREAAVKDLPKQKTTTVKKIKAEVDKINLSKEDLSWNRFLESITC